MWKVSPAAPSRADPDLNGERHLKRAFLKQTVGCLAGILTAAAVLAGCGRSARSDGTVPSPTALTPVQTDASDDYRTSYEIFVYSFCDSDGDGIGDLPGVLSKLDYINDGDPATVNDLDCDQIWLMPVCPSPTYHKYDVTDYCAIDPVYGTMEDFDALVEACHARGIRVIVDLVVNHTSVEHPWFQTAAAYLRELPPDWGASEDYCPEFGYYHFSREAQNGYAPLAGTNWYYEARFWEGMPDLNLDSNAVRSELAEVTEFWLRHGVDGFRLDAVTSYYTGDRNASVAFLSWLTSAVKTQSPEATLVGEAWAAQDEYARYYESGIDSLFDFAFAGQDGIIASVVKGNRPAADFAAMMESEEQLYASYNPSYVNAPFYTNHDMARSTGYYAYDDGSRTKLAGALNLLMTGNAFIYYGEEIGMKGSGKDENKRAPMFWTDGGAGADGNCSGPPEMDRFDMKFPSLAAQQEDPASVWQYYRDAVRMRRSIPVLARGTTVPHPELSGDALCVFERQAPEGAAYKNALVVINTGEEPQDLPLMETYKEPLCALVTGEERVTVQQGTVHLPAFAVAVFSAEE